MDAIGSIGVALRVRCGRSGFISILLTSSSPSSERGGDGRGLNERDELGALFLHTLLTFFSLFLANGFSSSSSSSLSSERGGDERGIGNRGNDGALFLHTIVSLRAAFVSARYLSSASPSSSSVFSSSSSLSSSPSSFVERGIGSRFLPVDALFLHTCVCCRFISLAANFRSLAACRFNTRCNSWSVGGLDEVGGIGSRASVGATFRADIVANCLRGIGSLGPPGAALRADFEANAFRGLGGGAQ